jgi:membrane protease YdiL (CAAX protease family)
VPWPFVLLLAAIAAVWLPLPRGWPALLPPWALLFAAALAGGWAQGVLAPAALAALLLLVVLAALVARTRGTGWQGPAWGLLVLWCVALVLHRVPGFYNPVAIDAQRFTADAAPFTQYLNFDKGAVGLVLLAWLAPRVRRGDSWGRLAATTALAWLLTSVAVLGLALAMGLVRPAFKLPAQAGLFLAVNLFLTCVAEQALFRLLVQDRLRAWRVGGASAMAGVGIVLSALLFGLAHAGGGVAMVLLASVAGLGHAIVYERTRRIEAPILVHFGLNATHFLAFTYPAVQA